MSDSSAHSPPSSNPFWKFSLRIWQCEEAKNSLMNLQNDFELDINLILFCLWLSCEPQRSIAMFQKDAQTISQTWQKSIIRNLRRARDSLPKEKALRQEILDCELKAERLEQDALYELYMQFPEAPCSNSLPFELIRANINHLLGGSVSITSEKLNAHVNSLVKSVNRELSLNN